MLFRHPNPQESAMQDYLQLWLPVVATGIAVFVASSLIHMVIKWHASDYGRLSNEDAVRDAIRAGSPAPGQYVLPHCADMKDMQGEAMRKKYIEGPIGFLTLKRNGPPTMGAALFQWFLYTLAIAAVSGAMAMRVFGLHGSSHGAGHLVGMVSFLAYTGGGVQHGIWMGKPWSAVARDALDGLIYGAIGMLVFTALWP
jgi:hypothetical protein